MARNIRNVQYMTRYWWTPVVLAPRGPGDLMDHDALGLVASGTLVISYKGHRAKASSSSGLARAPHRARAAPAQPGLDGPRAG